MLKQISNFLIGKRLPTDAIRHERLSNSQGLAIFASDSLSSTAYATEEILLVLVLAGSSLLGVALPIAIAITVLIFITAMSYRQLIFSHPEGGGGYRVARKHLGEFPSLVVSSSLIFDYILTAAVSVSAGVAAITSALPSLYPYKVLLAILVIIFLTIMNLRGVRESGKTFALPTYFFIGSILALIGVGFMKYLNGGLEAHTLTLAPAEGIGLVGIFLVIKAFAAGCTAMTGLEATANGIQSFKAPETKNANAVLLLMAIVLAVTFIGITSLAVFLNVVPSPEETVVSQVAQAVFDRGPLYFAVQGATMLILLLAANTAFAALPRLGSLLARDRYLPRQFFTLGSRLVYKNGIFFVAGISGLLIIFFNANTHLLIPLYAIGVFIDFTLVQWSMVKHWQEQERLHPEGNYRGKKAINMTGAITTGIVAVIVFVSKFSHGAWLVLPSLFLLIVGMRLIRAHYASVADQLSLLKNPPPVIAPHRTAVLLVSGVHQGTLKGLEAAKNIRPAHIHAVHVAIDEEEAERVKSLWHEYCEDVPLDILPSPERELIAPLADYVHGIDQRWKQDTVILVIPEFVPRRPWEHLLHANTALQIRWALSHLEDVEILDVPYRLHTKPGEHSLKIIRATFNELMDNLSAGLVWIKERLSGMGGFTKLKKPPKRRHSPNDWTLQ